MKSKAMLFLMVAILFWLPLASSSNSGYSTGFELGEIEGCFESAGEMVSGDFICLYYLQKLMDYELKLTKCIWDGNCSELEWLNALWGINEYGQKLNNCLNVI
jgi:hypothetical protein